MSEPEKIRENQEKEPEVERNDKGQFIKGQSGNVKGKPVGAGIGFSITRLVKEELLKIPDKAEGETYASLLIKKILIKAINDGDSSMIGKIWEYMDGKPKQSIELEGFDALGEQKESLLKLLEIVRGEEKENAETETEETKQ